MFITNPSSLYNTYITKSKIVKNYLIKNNIPLLSQDKNGFYFSKTSRLKSVLDNSPLWMRLLC